MVCPSSEELAALYDGTLPRALAQSLRNHVAFCQRCAQELKILHRNLASLGDTPAVPKALREKSCLIPVGAAAQKSKKIPSDPEYHRLPKRVIK